MLPKQLEFFKGMSGKWGSAKFALAAPHFYCSVCRAKNFDNKDHPRRFTSDGQEIPACKDSEMWDRDGAIFLDITSPEKGKKNVYDWANKITFALGLVDISKILLFLRTADVGGEMSLIHDPGAGTDTKGQTIKSLKLSSPKGLREGVILNVSKKAGEDIVSHTVPLSADEVLTLATLLQAALPKILAWN